MASEESTRRDTLWKRTNKTGKTSNGFFWDGDEVMPTVCHEVWSKDRLSNKLSLEERLKRSFQDPCTSKREPTQDLNSAIEDELKDLKSWEALVSCARVHALISWTEKFGKPLYSPRRHTQVKIIKRKDSFVLKRRFIDVNYEKRVYDNSCRYDEGDFLEELRLRGDKPIVRALEIVDSMKWIFRKKAKPKHGQRGKTKSKGGSKASG